eukprot:TRINITY_DN7599_c0_g1_i1.p1 TRINITY_DN7599_c0_g1~~TRINITY_DN7599_c0_g1_i1.p1  ORF type:complete len:301 (-),score=55.05 TRINITY_DN7599_c0_g1_i1:195-1097(-)
MGCVQSGGSQQNETSKLIEKQLKSKLPSNDQIKVLLLGSGESGKSTFFKQIQLNFLSGFSDEEYLAYREIILSNILFCMSSLVEATDELGHYEIDSDLFDEAWKLPYLDPDEFSLTDYYDIFVALLEDTAIKDAIENNNEFYLLDSYSYYFDQLERISSPDWVPSDQDILFSRVKTSGISEIYLNYEERASFTFIDVGGQRSERRKWMVLFKDQVSAIIFFVALSEYDLKLYEDRSVNRMHESLKLFGEICNSIWFESVNIILFLNKEDLFREKIVHSPLNVCFEDYYGFTISQLTFRRK